MTEDVRVMRLCDVCGALDTHPRHVLSVTEGGVPSDDFINRLPDGTPARAIVELMDPTTVVRHMDCCAQQGCQICVEVLAAVGGPSVKGDALVTALTSGAVDHLTTADGTEA